MKKIFKICFLLLALSSIGAIAKGIELDGAENLENAEILFHDLMMSGFVVRNANGNESVQVAVVQCHHEKGRLGTTTCYAIDEQSPEQTPNENLMEISSTSFPSVLLKTFGELIPKIENKNFLHFSVSKLTCLESHKDGKTTCSIKR